VRDLLVMIICVLVYFVVSYNNYLELIKMVWNDMVLVN